MPPQDSASTEPGDGSSGTSAGRVPVAVVTLKPGAGADPEEILEWARENIV